VGEADYSPLLAQLDAPPPVLTALGNVALAARPVVGIVGAREASAAGLEMARRLAEGLGAAGQVVASGLARGIDAAAHSASLKTGTIAVLAGGLGKPYPPQNLALFEAICAEGLVVAEAPPFAAARGRDFPRRNHVISGLSAGIVVVEAAWRSGSLITARAAGDQGRDVMAVPGSPLDPRSRGTNALLKEGAILVETAEDVLAALASAPRGVRPPDPLPLLDLAASAAPGLRDRLKALLSPTPVHVNTLARHLHAPAQGVAAALTELEIEGEALSYPGGYAASSPAAGGA
jgi:DNA processing protein